jgi:hypothetical protein
MLQPTIFLLTTSALDCFTTYMGITYFGLNEGNPFLKGMIQQSFLITFFYKFIMVGLLIVFTYKLKDYKMLWGVGILSGLVVLWNIYQILMVYSVYL